MVLGHRVRKLRDNSVRKEKRVHKTREMRPHMARGETQSTWGTRVYRARST